MRFIFMGTPAFGVESLNYLIKHHECLAVVTQPDKPVGRKRVLKPSPIKEVALEKGLLIFQPKNVKTLIETFKDMKPDMIITAAFGQILPQAVLDIPSLACLNLHASILPKYRGAAPIQRAIEHQEKITGVSLMEMQLKMDAGPVYGVKTTSVLDKTSGELFEELSVLAKACLEENLDAIIKGTLKAVPQDESLVTYAPKLTKEDEWLDLSLDAKSVLAKLRSLLPSPGGFITLNGETIKIYDASLGEGLGLKGTFKASKKHCEVFCGTGSIYLNTVQPLNKKVMPITAYLNGKPAEFFNDSLSKNEV